MGAYRGVRPKIGRGEILTYRYTTAYHACQLCATIGMRRHDPVACTSTSRGTVALRLAENPRMGSSWLRSFLFDIVLQDWRE